MNDQLLTTSEILEKHTDAIVSAHKHGWPATLAVHPDLQKILSTSSSQMQRAYQALSSWRRHHGIAPKNNGPKPVKALTVKSLKASVEELEEKARKQHRALPSAPGKTYGGKVLLMTPKHIAKRKYQAKWRRQHRAKLNGQPVGAGILADKMAAQTHETHLPAPASVSVSEAVPCNLSECPICHSRFYVIRGS